MKHEGTPQAPDWQLEPMEVKQEDAEAAETQMEPEPMTPDEAAEKYAVAEQLPTEPTAEQAAALTEQRERITRAFEEKQKDPERNVEAQKEADTYNKRFKFLEELAKGTDISLAPGQDLRTVLYDIQREKERRQLRSRLKAGVATSGITVVGTGTALAVVGPLAVVVGVAGMATTLGVMGGMKLYHHIRNKRADKQYSEIR